MPRHLQALPKSYSDQRKKKTPWNDLSNETEDKGRSQWIEQTQRLANHNSYWPTTQDNKPDNITHYTNLLAKEQGLQIEL